MRDKLDIIMNYLNLKIRHNKNKLSGVKLILLCMLQRDGK